MKTLNEKLADIAIIFFEEGNFDGHVGIENVDVAISLAVYSMREVNYNKYLDLFGEFDNIRKIVCDRLHENNVWNVISTAEEV